MNSKERTKFRQSLKWAKFRAYVKKAQNRIDPITGQKLLPGANLHHIDLDVTRYDNLDPSRFIFLNRKTHDLIHYLYPIWVNDPVVLKRIEILLKLMYKLTNNL